MKKAWMFPVVVAAALSAQGCFQNQENMGPEKNELSYGMSFGLTWTQLPGAGKDIAANYATPYIWSIDSGSGNQAIRYLNRTHSPLAWITTSTGLGTRVEVDESGYPWVINAAGGAYKGSSTGSSWTQYNLDDYGNTIGIYDIGAGGGAVWALGGSMGTYGYQVYIFDYGTGRWSEITTASGLKISVDNSASPWVVNNLGQVYQLTGGSWVYRSGVTASAIGAGAGGEVSVVGTVSGSPGGTIYKWTGSTWEDCSNGAGVEIDRGYGFTVVTNTYGNLFIGTP